ncbi:MAG: hypothetical protein Q9216_006019 [Gyalolechia sp. 2 TL-2023]
MGAEKLQMLRSDKHLVSDKGIQSISPEQAGCKHNQNSAHKFWQKNSSETFVAAKSSQAFYITIYRSWLCFLMVRYSFDTSVPHVPMPLSIIQFPKDQVQFLQVFHATQVAAEPPAIVRIQRKSVHVLRVASDVRKFRRRSKKGTSMAPSILFGIATGEEAAFPNATYLRKRYKKLQRCTISRTPSAQSARSTIDRSSLDPSFQAIRALNGQPGSRPEPVIVHAIIQDARHGFAGNVKLLPTTLSNEMKGTPIQEEHSSFSERVERMGQAIDRGQQIIFVPSDEPGKINVFARNADASNAASVENETFQYSRQATYSPIISANQRRDLENRIRAQIAVSAKVTSGTSIATAVRHERHVGVDQHKLCTPGGDGVQCHAISPVPLNYNRPREMVTPVTISGDSTSDLSSPTRQVAARQSMKAKFPTCSTQNDRSRNLLEEGASWYPNIAPSKVPSPAPRIGSRNPVEGPPGQQEKDIRVLSWIRRVKAAISPAKKSPAKRTGKAHGVFRDAQASDSNRWGETPIRRPDNVLRDMTNTRQPGYLERKSFAQERNMRERHGTEVKVQNRVKPQLTAVPSRALAGSCLQAPLPQARSSSRPTRRGASTGDRTGLGGPIIADSLPAPGTKSRGSSEASTVKRSPNEDDLHPEVAFTLARLEDRVPPPPASPIQRLADGASLYGSDVELELGRIKLDCPQPSRVPSDGSWTHRFEETIDEGFDCALEAPLSPDTATYIDLLRQNIMAGW